MVIEDGKFYFIKDEFFDVFKDYGLMVNKESGNKRPCYFCFNDPENEEIIWFVPISSKVEKYKAIYASSIGGAAAIISRTIKKCDLVCYEDLGPEAIYKLEVENFFCVVTYDTLGNDLYQEETNKYKNKQPL